MAVPEELEEVEVHEASDEEGRKFFDAAARRFLGISGEEFLRRWDAGEFDEDDRSEVTHLELLIPLVRGGR